MKTKLKCITNNIYLLFSPLLILYLIICLIKQQNILIGDEGRYLAYAHNLLNGTYIGSFKEESNFLWNGPGYPLFLTPFLYLKIPLLIPKLFNALFIYFGIIYLYRSLLLFLNKNKALLISLALGLYYPLLFESLPRILTEAISFFLVSFFTYQFITNLKLGRRKNFFLASIALGYLALTKVIFAYVIVTMFIVLVILLFLKPRFHTKALKQSLVIFLLGFLTTLPYLTYTYNITDKFFYYGNAGGMSLYWMSTPFEGELGDWHSFKTLDKKKEIEVNHIEFINSIDNLHPVAKDEALKNKAIENIINHKAKYFKNWISNLGRIFFGYPHDFQITSNRMLYYVIPDTLLVICLIMTFVLSLLKFKDIELPIILISSFSLIYLGGISLLSSYHRFLYPIMPPLLTWITYILDRYVSLKIKLKQQHNITI
ncbi:glycosyltransferase family 39 protein [Mangrovimonas sp. TPBH4]|uniref:ArnT family glycosyltransferase n=1 Tax=Mangrovimonas sp. TPBH4 TaxID=1645914 RepID=UPI0006B50154|nr:hypothetical protein [Mangrovimonas sp. TPBH4]